MGLKRQENRVFQIKNAKKKDGSKGEGGRAGQEIRHIFNSIERYTFWN